MDWKPLEVRDEYGNGFEFIQKDDLVLPTLFKGGAARLELIKELPYRMDDIMICSYPKTGTHWVFNLVHHLCANGPGDNLVTVRPTLMELLPPDMWETAPQSTLRSTHLKPDRLPSDLLKYGGKIILVIRNPKDVCVSFYHFLVHMRSEMKFGDTISWKRFIEAWIQGELPFGTYFDYYNTWEKEIANNKNLDVLVVCYDKIKENGLEQMRRIQAFLGLDHQDERLQKILDKCTVKNMKADVESGKTTTALVDEKGVSFLYRKGEVGDWKNYLTVAQSEYLDTIIDEKFKGSVFKTGRN